VLAGACTDPVACSQPDGSPVPTDDVLAPTGGYMALPLAGIWSRAPYLHDGCAKTLLDRFTTCDTGQHGVVNQLKSDELRALTDYLETL